MKIDELINQLINGQSIPDFKGFRTSTNEASIFADLKGYIETKPLQKSQQYQFIESHRLGKTIPDKYYSGDIDRLHHYYDKVNKGEYKPVTEYGFKIYLVYATLKLFGLYDAEKMDIYFNVLYKDGREYNPAVKIPNEVRYCLPWKIYDYDITQAYPSFIDMELGITRNGEDVYDLIKGKTRDKRKIAFNVAINTHAGNGVTIEKVRAIIEPAYPGNSSRVITDECFKHSGAMFRRLVKYEQAYIKKFAEVNNIKHFIRIHDGLMTIQNIIDPVLNFSQINFKLKPAPAIQNTIPPLITYNSKGKPILEPNVLERFFVWDGFVRVDNNDDELQIARVDNKIIYPFNYRTNLVNHLLNTMPINIADINSNTIASNAKSGLVKGLLCMQPTNPLLYKDTRDSIAYPFKNGLAKYTKSIGWELIPYSEVTGFFPKHTINNHNAPPLDKLEQLTDASDFKKFLGYICTNPIGETPDLPFQFNNLCKILGYLQHTFKDQRNNPCILFTDFGATGDTRNGRRGKGILIKALQQIRKSYEISGQEYKPDYNHNMAGVKKEHALFVLDEMDYSFRLESMYNYILNDIHVNPKGKNEFIIPFNESPKFIITSNFIIKYSADDPSTNERFCEFQLKPFFNGTNRTPSHYFNKQLFNQWNETDWQQFHALMLSCGQLWIDSDRQLNRPSLETKDNDNFNLVLGNDLVLGELERIITSFEENPLTDKFGVVEFLTAYNNGAFKYDKLFNKFTVKKIINAYLATQKKPKWKYSAIHKKWSKVYENLTENAF